MHLSTARVTASFRFVLVAIAVSLLAPAARADVLPSAPMIFDVRINLPLEPDEETYHDFYINAGPEAGFKRGMYITVVRPVPVHDPVQNKQQATLNVNVARLQVIHTERAITVARLFSEFTDEERPTLEFESVMIGDRIDVSGNTMEAPGAKKKVRPAVKSRTASRLEKVVEKVEDTARAEIHDVIPATLPTTLPAPNSVPAVAPPGTSSSSPIPTQNPTQNPVQIPVPPPPGSSSGASPAGVTTPSRSTSSGTRIPLLAGD